MEIAARIGPLSRSREDSTGSSISDPVPFDEGSDKVHKDYMEQNEISSDDRENHSHNALLGPQSLQELIRAEHNGCVDAELSFSEGIYLFWYVRKMLCLLWMDEQATNFQNTINDAYIFGMILGCITSEASIV
jgi:hypothetical protein